MEASIPAGRSRFAAAAPFAFILLWSSAFIAVRAGLPHVSPLYFLSTRFTLAAAILLAIALITRTRWTSLRGQWHHFVVAGVLINGVYLSLGYLAMTRISGATLALLGSLHPILVALASVPLLGDRFRTRQWLGFALGTLGVAMVAGINMADAAQSEGMLWGLCAVLCFVVGTLYYSRFCRGVDLVLANMLQLAAAAGFCWLLTFAFEDIHAEWTPVAVLTLLHLTIGVSLGGMGLLLFMLKTGTAGKVSANFYLIPGVTAVMGWAILGEGLAPLAIAGFVTASAGVWLVNRG